MSFRSLLFSPQNPTEPPAAEADVLADLGLDQVFAAIAERDPDHDLMPFLVRPVDDADLLADRQAVFRALQTDSFRAVFESFAKAMHAYRQHFARTGKLRDFWQRQIGFFESAGLYRQAVDGLAATLAPHDPHAPLLEAFAQALENYRNGDPYQSLCADLDRLGTQIDRVHYFLLIHDGAIRISRYDGQANACAAISDLFARFRSDGIAATAHRFPDLLDMNHIEYAVLERVAELYPELFAEIDRFAKTHAGFADAGLLDADRDLNFYLAVQHHFAGLERAGLPICLPALSASDKRVAVQKGYDIALAGGAGDGTAAIVTNNFGLSAQDRMFVVTGPNQGGKTTFARTVGQLHFLAALGGPVTAESAKLFITDRIFTHFGRAERALSDQGRLMDDLNRIHAITEAASGRSLIVLNELFASTTAADALLLLGHIVDALTAIGGLAVIVTFLDEIAERGAPIVSLVAGVDPHDSSRRTFKIEQRPPDGKAYALSIAEKYGLTAGALTQRIRS